MMSGLLRARLGSFVAAAAVAAAAGGAFGPSAALAQGVERPAALEEWARGQLSEILARADDDEGADLGAAAAELSRLFDALIAYGDEREAEAWVETAQWLRLARFFEEAPSRQRGQVWAILRGNPTFAGNLAFVLKEEDEAEGMGRVMLSLAHRNNLQEFATLAAAMCVVHETPHHHDANENRAESPDPGLLFDYFVAHERELLFKPQTMPPDILIYLVDATAEIEELEWALRKHKGDRKIGSTYFDIAYDTAHFRDGTPKKSTVAGWGLQNIAKHGGLCVDRSYYAMTCGKAIGVPTVDIWASDAEVAHAWVGFIEGRGSRAEWNLEFGRFDTYKGVSGRVFDPQTRQHITDAELSFLAESITEPRSQRWAAAALTDAAKRVLSLSASREAYPPPYPFAVETSRELPRTRQPTLEEALGLLETGLRQTPGYAPGWGVVKELAASGKLNYEQKQEWAKALDRLTGTKYPDFTLSVLRPMIETVEDADRQHELWDRAMKICSGRADLAAQVRMAQGKLWERQDEKSKAWACYMEVVQRHANDGPFVIDALKAMERMLRVNGKRDQVRPLYEDAWKRMRAPSGPTAEQFMVQSNYYRVGKRYAQLLEEAGRTNEATIVRGRIGLKTK